MNTQSYATSAANVHAHLVRCPSVQDVSGLLALKDAIAGGPEMCAQEPAACAIFETWDTQNGPPCPVAQCTACTLEHGTCGTYNPATNTTTCSWRYVECKNSRVSRIVLGKQGSVLSNWAGYVITSCSL